MFIVKGCRKLFGEVEISGAKNAALPLMAASILTDETVVLRHVPRITDVLDMKDILASIGAEVDFQGNTMTICAGEISACAMPEELSHKIRSSIFMLGSMLGRKQEACFFMPGGCEIGKRPIDMHIDALGRLGVETEQREGRILCTTRGLKGAEIALPYPSVGATENIMLAAVLADGVTVICNAAKEPEIVCLAEMLRSMGAEVHGAGTSVVYIKGVRKLHGTEFACIPDRIEAGTFLCAAAAAGGRIVLRGIVAEHIAPLISILHTCGCVTERRGGDLVFESAERLKSFSLETAPYPGFPTDLQSQMCALACRCRGISQIRETVFENRMHHLDKLAEAGGEIARKGDTVLIRGCRRLKPADYTAHDLRGGAAFVIAALSAKGESIIRGTHFIDRGYERFEDKLSALGADIIRV